MAGKSTSVRVLHLFLWLGIFFIQSCQDQYHTPPEYQPEIFLTAIDTSCTEAWLNVRVQNVDLPVSVLLYEADSVIQTISSLNNSDTIICVGSLIPNQIYNFRGVLSYHNKNYSSDVVSLNTMDTLAVGDRYPKAIVTLGRHQ